MVVAATAAVMVVVTGDVNGGVVGVDGGALDGGAGLLDVAGGVAPWLLVLAGLEPPVTPVLLTLLAEVELGDFVSGGLTPLLLLFTLLLLPFVALVLVPAEVAGLGVDEVKGGVVVLLVPEVLLAGVAPEEALVASEGFADIFAGPEWSLFVGVVAVFFIIKQLFFLLLLSVFYEFCLRF